MQTKMDEKSFREAFEKKVTVRIVSSRGHDEYVDIPELALAKIMDETKNGKKWLYIDGVQENPDSLTIEKLVTSEYVILTNALIGG